MTAYQNQSEKFLGKIPKNDQSDIEVRIITNKTGDSFIDIRESIKTENYTGLTKKGIRFHAENFDAFMELVKSVDRVLMES